MSTSPLVEQGHVTRLLRDWQNGAPGALDRLVLVVHTELKRLARVHMRGERPGNTLQPTALVNEVYLRLAGIQAMNWRDRVHFFAMASRLMRRVLVEAARTRRAAKRGASPIRVSLDEVPQVEASAGPMPDLLALDEAIDALGALDPRKARVVELRFFSGLSVNETAAALDVSAETVARDWRFAKLWLRRELQRGTHA